VRNERPAVLSLPHEIRRGDGGSERARRPGLPSREQPPLRGQKQSERERGEIERDRVLGEEGRASDRARGIPPARIVVPLGLDDAERDGEPRQGLQRVGRQEGSDRLEKAADERGEAGEPAGVEPAAEHGRRLCR